MTLFVRHEVPNVPPDLRPEFHQLYGEDFPLDRLVFDILETDDARSFQPGPNPVMQPAAGRRSASLF